MPDGRAPVDQDLERLAKMFVRYAMGETDSFPHARSVSLAIGGERAGSVDHVAARLPNRAMWRVCPDDWGGYGAASCPVNLLGPITDAARNNAGLVYSAQVGTVTCAPTRSGPLPTGRVVVLRPTREWRTCATDFALALVADEEGRLGHIDVTLAAP